MNAACVLNAHNCNSKCKRSVMVCCSSHQQLLCTTVLILQHMKLTSSIHGITENKLLREQARDCEKVQRESQSRSNVACDAFRECVVVEAALLRVSAPGTVITGFQKLSM